MNKTIYNTDFLFNFCNIHNISLIKTYETTNRDTVIEGKCLTELCDNNFNKSFRQLAKTGGFCIICSKINHQNKIKEVVLEKYGVENVFQLNNIKLKSMETNLNKYGVKYATQNKVIKDKTKFSCLQKYGVDNPSKSIEIKEQIQNTCLQKFGVSSPLKSYEIREKAKNTYLNKYGVEYISQVPEIAEKAFNNSFKKKEYMFPSGNVIMCQGYEPFALDKLINEENINEENIITGCKNVPTIWYQDETGKKHRHYVDIFIPSQNRCIEVKSTWTAEKKKDNIYLKQSAAKELGYLYEIWIYNSKKELVNTLC
jgi:hypothetical protein